MLLTKRIVFMYMLSISATQYIYAQETHTRLPELDPIVGSWKVTAETRLSANGPWEINKGTAMIKKTTGSTLIEEEYTGMLNSKSFFTESVIAYNHFTNVFQRIFIDSEHGVLVDYEGEKKADTIFFNKTWTYPNGATVKLRVVYTIISADEFKIENMRMPEDSSKWDLTNRMHYVRIR